MRGPKRRKAVAILIFLQAILFGLTTPIGNYSLLRFIAADPTLGGVARPGWYVSEGQLNFDQVFGLAVAIIVAVLAWRGLPLAFYLAAAFAALGALYGVVYTALEFLVVGPRAVFFLFFFPLPTVPPSVIAIPALLLSAAVIAENWNIARGPRRKAFSARLSVNARTSPK